MPCVKGSHSELKLVKHLDTFSCRHKMKKSPSGFGLVMVVISKQSILQLLVWPVCTGKSY